MESLQLLLLQRAKMRERVFDILFLHNVRVKPRTGLCWGVGGRELARALIVVAEQNAEAFNI